MPATSPDLVCFSHLRWDHVFQRPHHLMSRAAHDRRVLCVEEPLAGERSGVDLRVRGRITVVTPRFPAGLPEPLRSRSVERTVGDFLTAHGVRDAVLWYYTPLALEWTWMLPGSVVVYDCMDELSAFRKADPRLPLLERELLQRADVVFTGGHALFDAKRSRHPDVHAFPSAVDFAHFAHARTPQPDPADQAPIPHPRLGWFGVIDERFDRDLVEGVALLRPDWSIVLVGPVAKIDPATIPALPNVHQLGRRTYDELPAYLAGWDVAIMPFARNASTQFISPTKTPEYLAGGRPVVATSIADVVRPYGVHGLVRIADEPAGFVASCEAAMADDPAARQRAADTFLAGMSWDRTWSAMNALVDRAARRRKARVAGVAAAVPGTPATAGIVSGSMARTAGTAGFPLAGPRTTR